MYLLHACISHRYISVIGTYLLQVYISHWHASLTDIVSYKRASLAGIYLSFTSLPCASDTGGESPYIDTQDGRGASDCGRLGRQAAGHPWSALRAVKSCRKDCPTASVLLEAKAAALHSERYQSSLSELSTNEGG